MNKEDSERLSDVISNAVYRALKQSLPEALLAGGLTGPEDGASPAKGTAAQPETTGTAPQGADDKAIAAIKARFFPDFLAHEELKPYMEEWKRELNKGEAANISVLAMCANLFTWSIFYKLDGADADAAASNALYNFSRYFFEWAYDEKNLSGNQAWHLAYIMQGAFNEKLEANGALYVIDMPDLGGQFESSSMVKSPRCTQGGHDVAAIHAWGLSNTQNNVYKKKSLVIIS